jgi:hypothetical protein
MRFSGYQPRLLVLDFDPVFVAGLSGPRVAFSGPAYQPIHFALVGKTDSVHGALRNTFEAAPDVPVSRFRLELFGGKRGLVEMSSGLCAHPDATIRLRGHNGKEYDTRRQVKAKCARGKKQNAKRAAISIG